MWVVLAGISGVVKSWRFPEKQLFQRYAVSKSHSRAGGIKFCGIAPPSVIKVFRAETIP